MLRNFFTLSLLLLTLLSCGSAGKKERLQFLSQFRSANYAAALQTLETAKIYREKDSKLLYFLEKGLVLHATGRFQESITALTQAKNLARKLFTTSIKGKIAKGLANDSYDVFYGSTYELSLIHFYLTLNHFLIYQNENKRSELMAARAEVLDWDSHIEDLGRSKKGKSVFKNDLIAKTFGAFIHESVGGSDNDIALQLYKDAKELYVKNYSSYPTFNAKSSEFNKNFEKFPSMSLDKVKSKYIQENSRGIELKNFLDYKILSLTKFHRKHELKKMIKLHRPNTKIVAYIKKIKKKSNFGILFQEGLIPRKKAKENFYSLGAVLSDPKSSGGAKAAAAIGSVIFTAFAANKLGLRPTPKNYHPGRDFAGLQVTSLAVRGLAIGFELPEIAKSAPQQLSKIRILDSTGKEVYKNALPLINPMGDIAKQSVMEFSKERYLRTGIRVVGKHLAAIATAYGAYKALTSGKGGDFFAKSAAVLSYAASTRIIAASEKADTRYWSSLPGGLRFIDFYLPKGDYQVFVDMVSETKAIKTYFLGKVSITSEKQKKLLNFRSKNFLK